MEIYKVESVEMQADWRFYEVIGDVYEVSDDAKEDCSVCMVGVNKPIKKFRVILPTKLLEKLRR